MKKKILNLGVTATHSLITVLGGGLNEPRSISEFDAFLFDPNGVGATQEAYFRRQREVQDLIAKKGGVVVCLLRQPPVLGFNIGGRQADAFGILEAVASQALAYVRSSLRVGSGSHVKPVSNANTASAGYFRILSGALKFVSYLDGAEDVKAFAGTVSAVDSIDHPVGFELTIGPGRICFVPVPDGAASDRIGAAIVRIVESHFGGSSEIDSPPWLVEVEVPSAGANDAAISGLEEQKAGIDAAIRELSEARLRLLNHRVLLYGYGKSVLEPAVRSAFTLIGFDVPEPDEYLGEWDVELRESASLEIAIGEIEGSEGVIDVDKYRQLLDYVQSEVLEGRDHKGILIGNGYRLTTPDSPERLRQFSNHALLGATKNGFCLLPTTELFKAVCAVLRTPNDPTLPLAIRTSILKTIGVWSFASEVSGAGGPEVPAVPDQKA